ncbi:hypothetical protein QBC34DRAFT_393413 [Podospora aff. communis PSN243]|uniref:Uncharacterized protein n=1 Tax=Podospora aff. communis PSN243 TaxID=3040156 RepID=A0AAV9H392_9PEZI|nr:hypothetical protein QBC34DRAFT_393413 [Podospora aff. communis PSN243]
MMAQPFPAASIIPRCPHHQNLTLLRFLGYGVTPKSQRIFLSTANPLQGYTGTIPHGFQHCRAMASEPRDHVFGVLGFKFFSLPIRIDYSAPVRDVFTTFLAACLNVNTSLASEILRYSGSGTNWRGQNQHNLPSWAEDFSQSLRRYIGYSNVNAGLGLPSQAVPYTIDLNTGTLSIPCIQCDVVEQVQGNLPEYPEDWDSRFSEFFSYVWEVIRNYDDRVFDGGTSPIEAIARVLHDDEMADPSTTHRILPNHLEFIVFFLVYRLIQRIPDKAEFLERFGLETGRDSFLPSFYSAFPFLDRRLAPAPLRDDSLDEEQISRKLWENAECSVIIRAWLRTQKETVESRCLFFHTANGRLGKGPPGMVATDMLYISPVSNHVLVVRCRPEGGVTYVGPAFVLGLSHGEASEMFANGTLEGEFEWLCIF